MWKFGGQCFNYSLRVYSTVHLKGGWPKCILVKAFFQGLLHGLDLQKKIQINAGEAMFKSRSGLDCRRKRIRKTERKCWLGERKKKQ